MSYSRHPTTHLYRHCNKPFIRIPMNQLSISWLVMSDFCSVGQVAIWRLAILEALRRSVAYLALLATYVAWSKKRHPARGDPVLFEALKNSPWTPKCPAKFSWRDWFLVILFHPKSLWVHQESPRFLLVTSVGLYGSIFCLKFFNPLKRQMLFPCGFETDFAWEAWKSWGQSVNQGQVMSSFLKRWQVLFSY